MSFDADDEILQDFLVEAGEILETLNAELVDLEQTPDDADKINSVFRSFHTIKGGAGFLSLTPLVELCHRAEDVFGLIRNGELHINAGMMDVFLTVLDSLNSMFDELKLGQEPSAADPEQLKALDRILSGEASAGASEPEPKAQKQEPIESTATANENAAGSDSEEEKDFTDEEFENLLDSLDSEASGSSKQAGSQAAKEKSDDVDLFGLDDADDGDDLFGLDDDDSGPDDVNVSDEITDSEFDSLLDQLHGQGGSPSSSSSDEQKTKPKKEQKTEQKPKATVGGDSDIISDDEFEQYLDELHGKGQFGNVSTEDHGIDAKAEPEPKPAEVKPENKVEPPPPPPPANKPAAPEVAASKPAPAKGKRDANQVQSETTVRVDTKRLDDIMNMVGELVLVRNRLVTLDNNLANEDLSKAVNSLDVVTSDLQTSVMKTRMQPVKKVFGRFPRVVRDISRSMKKEVQLILIGEETDLDKNLVEALADPLVHLVRNSVDHGVELPDVREQNGKPRQGTVTLSAAQEGDHILLTIEDDGAGMDAEFLRNKVVQKGLMDHETAERLDKKECFSLIFMPGFSTKDVISDVSGRGVGMDVVRTRISQLNGSVEIDSEIGRGTVISIMVPLTLAIMPTLMVNLKEQSFALPLVSVSEIFHLDLTKTNMVDGQLVIMVRDKPLPLFYLTKWLIKGHEYDELPSKGHVVVVHVGTKKVGFVVDELIGQEEVVIKPLGALLQGTQGLAGATITGDGQIALIVDIPSLMSSRVT
ncbi:MAG: chemotaxis protein CheA [Gammaproteobacteria bacterium]|nr:chemotaxis protein CheA [Gammaproteobacteria bacterium]